MNNEYIPENNLVVLFLMVILSAGFYYFWWLAKTSRLFDDNPVSNIMLIILTAGLWWIYLSFKYMQKSEQINGREMKWYMVFFFPFAFLIVQNNINEHFFPGR